MRLVLSLTLPLSLLACGDAKVDIVDTGTGLGTDDTSDTSASAADIVVDPSSLDFGTILPGESVTKGFIVRNAGAEGATLALAVASSAYTLDVTTATLGAGDEVGVNVVFAGVTGGDFEDAVVVTDFYGLEAARVRLVGKVDSNVDVDGDGFLSAEDCDDTKVDVHPGAQDPWYDGVDSDCAGNDDFDQDGDGHVAVAFGGDDCNDAASAIYPGAPETWYDGVDADCAGDDDFDADADGQRDEAYGGTDCDDTDATVYAGAPETWYDGVDADCAGDDDFDQDGDGVPVTADDCDDTDATVYAGAPETWYDGVDSDCAGDDDFDADADGDRASAYGGGDCADADTARSSLLTEACDGIDNDCDGIVDDGFPILTTPFYADVDGDGYGAGTAVYACTLPPAYVLDATDCDDTAAAVNPGHAEVHYNHTDDDCNAFVDDMVAEVESSWTVKGNRAGDAVGAGVSVMVDDLAYDGHPELITCAPDIDISGYADLGGCGFLDVDTASDPVAWDAGVFEYYGGTVSGDGGELRANEGLGTGVVQLGDQDGDGYEDIVFAGAGYDGSSSTNRGALFFVSAEAYVGSSMSYTAGVSYPWGVIYGSNGADALGSSLASGDVDGDGANDLAAGAPGYSGGAGRVYLFLHDDFVYVSDRSLRYAWRSAGDAASYAATGVSSGDHLGTATLLADVDDDGYDDLVACAPDDDDNGASSGSCWMDRGGASIGAGATISTVADGQVFGAAANDQLGATREALAFGDVDGDARGDLGVGLPGYDLGTTDGGAVAIWTSGTFSGVESLGTATWLVTGDGGLGTSVRLPGDVDGDGIGDLLAGAPSAGAAGRVYLLGGGFAAGTYALPAQQDASWVGQASGDAFGTSLSGLRDLTGDGRDEFAVGAPGNDSSALSNAGKVYLVPAYP